MIMKVFMANILKSCSRCGDTGALFSRSVSRNPSNIPYTFPWRHRSRSSMMLGSFSGQRPRWRGLGSLREPVTFSRIPWHKS
jgi:hypothetical protein